ncbi:amidohydrolase family protein [Catenulispora yoronensis]
METVPVERIVFAVDYPFVGNEGALPFFEGADISEETKHQIAHKNAERLLRL